MRKLGRCAMAVLLVAVSLDMAAGRPAMAAGSKTVEAEGEAANSRFFRMEPFTVTAIRSGGVKARMVVTLGLELKDPETREVVQESLTRLTDAFLTDLYGVAALPWPNGRSVDPALVKRRLLRISERILGPGTVQEVLIYNIHEVRR